MKILVFLFPLLIWAFNIEGYNDNTVISKQYCYSKKNSLKSYIVVDNYKLDKNYLLKKISHIDFAPHEKVFVYYFDNNQNTIKKVFSFCVPGFTKKERNYITKNTSIWTKALKDIIGEAKDNKETVFYTRLRNVLKKIPLSNSKSDFSNALSNIDFDKQARIFIFSVNNLKNKASLNYSYGVVYRKKVPSLNEKRALKAFFMRSRGYLSGINYSFIEKAPNEYHFYDLGVKVYINNKPYKAHFMLIVDGKGNSFNSWFEIYGILLAPIKAKVKFFRNIIISVKAEVLDDYKYYGNVAKKGDKIEIKKLKGKYIGKYYNYGYVLKNNTDSYFEYKIKE